MRRVLVIGCPGAGKSVFSRNLGRVTGIDVVHLDNLYWNKDKSAVSKIEFRSRLCDEIQKDSWIIDGNYSSTLDLRLSACDTVFFLDIPTELCLDGISSRIGISRPDMPWIEQELDEEFVEYVKNFNDRIRPSVLNLLENHPEVTIFRFTSHAEADDYIKTYKK